MMTRAQSYALARLVPGEWFDPSVIWPHSTAVRRPAFTAELLYGQGRLERRWIPDEWPHSHAEYRLPEVEG